MGERTGVRRKLGGTLPELRVHPLHHQIEAPCLQRYPLLWQQVSGFVGLVTGHITFGFQKYGGRLSNALEALINSRLRAVRELGWNSELQIHPQRPCRF
jgi:hypothetical protein